MRPIPDDLARLYPPREGVAGRPWWRVYPGGFLRSDGWSLPAGPEETPNVRSVWRPTEGRYLSHDLIEAPDAVSAMAALDRKHPLPCPPPRCGQVWHFCGIETTCIVVATCPSRAMFGLAVPGGDVWPPPNALLLHDPFGHPWAPVE